MQFYNPTGWPVEVRADRKEYFFKPYTNVDIHQIQHVNVLSGGPGKQSRARNEHAIVMVDYDVQSQKKYKTLKEYKVALCIEALMRLKIQYHKYYVSEKQAELQVKHKSGAEVDRLIFNPQKFLDKEKEIQGWIDQLKNGTHPLFDEFKSPERSISLADLSQADINKLKKELGVSARKTNRNYTGKRKGQTSSNPAMEVAKASLDGQTGNKGFSQAEA